MSLVYLLMWLDEKLGESGVGSMSGIRLEYGLCAAFSSYTQLQEYTLAGSASPRPRGNIGYVCLLRTTTRYGQKAIR